MKILYVTTISATMGFFKEEFHHLKQEGHEIELACNCENAFGFDIYGTGYKVHNLPLSRSPFTINNLLAYKVLKKLVRTNHYDIIHCHTPNAAAITRTACRGIRKYGTRIIYTAHGFHFYKGAPLKNWLIFYPIEWLCAHWTDMLITMNSEDYLLATKRMRARKVDYVPGVGIDTKKFLTSEVDIIKKRSELGLSTDDIVLLSVGELNDNKNHETVLKAIVGLNVKYIIAGKGEKEEYLLQLAKNLGIENKVQLLGFRKDVPELLRISDVFVFPSFREGLSVSLMETMASGKPAVVSNIRGNVDLIDENGGALFNPYSVAECKDAIQKVVAGNRSAMGKYNAEKIKKFDLAEVLNKIDSVYADTHI